MSDGAQSDIVAASLPAPDATTMMAMSKREQKLRNAASCQRALALPLSSRQEISRQIRLRVVREFNLPDGVAELLEDSTCYCVADEDTTNMNTSPFTETHAPSDIIDADEVLTVPSSPPPIQTNTNGSAQTLNTDMDPNLTFPRQQQMPNYGHTMGSGTGGSGGGGGCVRRLDLPALITERYVRLAFVVFAFCFYSIV